MPPVWKGSKKVFKGRAMDLIQGVGPRLVDRWEGANSEMLPKALNYYASGWNVSLRPNEGTPIWTVEAAVEGDPNNPNTDIVNIHELHGNVLNPSNLTSPYLHSQFTGDPDACIAYVVDLANEVRNGNLTYTEAVSVGLETAGLPIVAADVELCTELLKELLRGVTHYYKFQLVYRHTYNFGPLSSMRAGVENIGCIFQPEELIDEEGIPDLEAEDILDMGGEWLKVFPQKRVELGQRRQVSREYWWADDASPLYYPPAI